MTASHVVVAPFRMADGEGAPESCQPNEADGWRVWAHPHGRTYYYRTKPLAMACAEALGTEREPIGGGKWWPRPTVFLP